MIFRTTCFVVNVSRSQEALLKISVRMIFRTSCFVVNVNCYGTFTVGLLVHPANWENFT